MYTGVDIMVHGVLGSQVVVSYASVPSCPFRVVAPFQVDLWYYKTDE